MWESKMWVLALCLSFFVSPAISDPSFGGGGRNRAANDNSEVLKELGLDIGSEGTGKCHGKYSLQNLIVRENSCLEQSTFYRRRKMQKSFVKTKPSLVSCTTWRESQKCLHGGCLFCMDQNVRPPPHATLPH